MAAASSSSLPLVASDEPNSKLDLLKEVRAHEVAISELNSVPDSRAVYQKNGNIFFRRNVKSAIEVEQSFKLFCSERVVVLMEDQSCEQLDLAKAQIEKLSTAK